MKIFISYRRADSHSNTDRVHDHLADVFGADNVFQDVLDIDYGHDFRDVLRERVTTCDVLLVIIGPQWVSIVDQDDPTSQPRLFNPDDFVRFEVETGINSDDVLVIPVLVNSASIPEEDQLPASLHPLLFRNAIIVRNNPYFDEDINRLIHQLRDHADEHDIAIQRRRTVPRSWLWVALATIIVTLVVVGLLIAVAQRASDDDTGSLLAEPPEFISEDWLDAFSLGEEFEAVPSETFSEDALIRFLIVDQVFWGTMPALETYGYDIRMIITNTSTREIKLALDSRYFALEDTQGQQAEMVYFCCATENALLTPGQEREVRLIFKERENWGGPGGKYEGGGVETVFFLRVNGFLPIVRGTWVLDIPLTAN